MLFNDFNINYSKIDSIFRKGSVLYRYKHTDELKM